MDTIEPRLVASILAATLIILLLLHRRSRSRGDAESSRTIDNQSTAPRSDGGIDDHASRRHLISRAAASIVIVHQIFSVVMGFLAIGMVVGLAIFSPLVRYILLLTLAAMVIVALLAFAAIVVRPSQNN